MKSYNSLQNTKIKLDAHKKKIINAMKYIKYKIYTNVKKYSIVRAICIQPAFYAHHNFCFTLLTNFFVTFYGAAEAC